MASSQRTRKKASYRTDPGPQTLGDPWFGPRKRTAWLLAVIVIVAAGLRFPALDRSPPGVYPDEAINGVQGWEAAQDGNFKIFYPENNGREGLWINLIGITERLIGPSHFSLRLWSAVSGTLTVVGIFFLARELFESDSVALISAAFLATSFWHLNFSRIAFPGIMVPLFLTWGTALLLIVWRDSNPQALNNGASGSLARVWLISLAGGICFGIGFHSYAAYRFAPFVVAPFFLAFWPRKELRRDFLIASGIWMGGAVIAAFPLAVHFWFHPEDFFRRASQVSVWTDPTPLRTFATVFVKTLGMFNLQGDGNWRHNISSFPELLLPVGLFFPLGLWLAGRESFREKGIKGKLFNRFSLPLWWLAVMLLPEELTAEGIPHALRSIGVLPAVMILAALGLDWLYRKWPSRVAVMGILTVIAIVEGYRYFGVWSVNPETADAFTQIYVNAGKQLNALPQGTPRFVIVDAQGALVSHRNPDGTLKGIPLPAQTIMFETLGHPPVTYLLPQDVPKYSFPPGAFSRDMK
jgi:4-amino-4-deoxy-L-arabinose transferase-like glycosyltransferase